MLMRSVEARLRAPFATTVVVALVLALAVPLTAVASPPSSLDFTLLLQSQGTGNPLLLVAGHLPEGTALPVELVLPVPEGSVVEWSGEIFGGPVEEDEAVPATIENRDGVTVAVMTLSQSRIGQVEVSFPGAIAPADDDTFTGSFEVSAPFDVPLTRVAVGLPPGMQATALPEGALTAQGPQGYTHYYRELADVPAGGPIAFSIQYRETGVPDATGATGGQSASGEVPLLLIILIAAVLAGAVLVVLASRSRARVSDDEDVATTVIAHEESVENEVAIPADDPVEEAPTAPTSSSWLRPQRLLVIAVILLVGTAAIVILGGQQGQVGVTENVDGWIIQRVSTASSKSTVDFNIQITCECPPELEAPKIFEALRQTPGVAQASLEEATLLLRVEYDPALTNEAAIAQTLQGAGYLP